MVLDRKVLNAREEKKLNKDLIANAAGGKESAIVIWKAEKPRCFKGIDVFKLPVTYYNQANAWMNGEILDDILSKLNRHLSSRS